VLDRRPTAGSSASTVSAANSTRDSSLSTWKLDVDGSDFFRPGPDMKATDDLDARNRCGEDRTTGTSLGTGIDRRHAIPTQGPSHPR